MTTTTLPKAAVRRRRNRAITVVGAAIATLAVWTVAVPVAGVELVARTGSGSPTQTIAPAAVVLTTLLAGLAGWGLLALLERFTTRARRTWIVIALVVLVLSLAAGPLGGVTAGAKVALACLHLAAGAVLIPLLGRADRTSASDLPIAPAPPALGGQTRHGGHRIGYPPA